jgi:hypothetical protein
MSVKRATAARHAAEIQIGISDLKVLMDVAWFNMKAHKDTGTIDETSSFLDWKRACSRYQLAVDDCNLAYREEL